MRHGEDDGFLLDNRMGGWTGLGGWAAGVKRRSQLRLQRGEAGETRAHSRPQIVGTGWEPGEVTHGTANGRDGICGAIGLAQFAQMQLTVPGSTP